MSNQSQIVRGVLAGASLLLSAAPVVAAATPVALAPRVAAQASSARAADGKAADAKGGAKPAAIEGNVGLLGRDNIQLARELYKRGYTDLAEMVCRAMETGGKTNAVDKDELTAVRALYLDLRLDAIRGEEDPFARKGQIKEILKEKESFIANNIRSSEAQAAQETLPDVYRAFGEAVIACIKKETDDAKRGALREEGQTAFDHAIETLRDRRDRLKQQMDDLLDEPPNELLYAHRDAMYNLARTYYFNALLYPQGDSQQVVSLDHAKEEFNEFDLSYSEQLLAYDGRIMLGLAYKDSGGPENEKEALSVFDSAIALRETYYTTPDGKYDMPNEAADLVSSAVLQKALLLGQLKRYDELDAACEDFYKTTDQWYATERGLPLLAAHMDAMTEKGDSAKARELAERLDKYGAGTQWAAYGRKKLSEFLNDGSGISAGADKLLAIGRSLIDETPERAIAVLQQARSAARGDKNEPNIGAESLFWIGVCYRRMGNAMAAALAYESASDLYTAGQMAPDALVESTKQWRELYKETKYPSLKTRIDETQDHLLARYPNHAAASSVLLRDCQDLETDRKYLEAAQCYLSVKQDSPSWRDAQVRAAQNLYQHASYIVNQEKRPVADAKTFIDQIEPIVGKVLPLLEGEMTKTLDLQLQGRFAQLGFLARKVLATTHLLTKGNEAKALKALENVETIYGAYPNFIGQAWSLRIIAHKNQGTLTSAMQAFDGLMAKDPNSPAVAAAAGVLADALNDQANAEREKKHDSMAADDLQKKAANYYRIHVAPMLRGDGASADRLSEIGKNMFVYGLDLNRISGAAGNRVTFVGWTPAGKADKSYFADAARILEYALQMKASYQNSVYLGRSLGFLEDWKRGGEIYARLFEQERIVNTETDTLSAGTIKNKQELVSGYLEYGVCEHQTWLEDRDRNRLERAKAIYTTLVKTYKAFPDTLTFWQSRFQLCKLLADAGDYEAADLQIKNVEDNFNKDFDEGKFGYKDDFLKLKASIKDKVPRR